MAAKLFLAAVALIGVMWLLGRYNRATPAQRNRALRTILLYGIGAALLVLVLTGKLPWLFALVSAAVPWLNRALTMRQMWGTFRGFRQAGNSSARGAKPGAMDAAEAYEVLGLASGASKREIIEAHRKLIRKIHPDRGGSDYLAARINQAKEVLLAGRA
ncbi:MAG: DnaJ domain-containing protein [Gammaproteobacteria bacterium]